MAYAEKSLDSNEFFKHFGHFLKYDHHMSLAELYLGLNKFCFNLTNFELHLAERAKKRRRNETEFWVPKLTLEQVKDQNAINQTGRSTRSATRQSSHTTAINDDELVSEEKIRSFSEEAEKVNEDIGVHLESASEESDDDILSTAIDKRKVAEALSDSEDKDATWSPKKPTTANEDNEDRDEEEIEEEEPPKPANVDILVTPFVHLIAGEMFGRQLTPIGENGELIDGKEALRTYHESEITVREAEQAFMKRLGNKVEKYEAGDCVLFRDGNGSNAAIEIGRIIYAFTKHGQQMAHIQCFEHGSAIEELDELAHRKELFLLSDCKNVQLKYMAAKIRVDIVSQDGPIDEGYTDGDHYFYRLNYDPSGHVFTAAAEFPPSGVQRPCACCEFEESEQLENTPQTLSQADDGSINGVRYRKVDYQPLDFVYLNDEDCENVKRPSEIGQIHHIGRQKIPEDSDSSDLDDSDDEQEEPLTIEVVLYQRFDDILPKWSEELETKHVVRDERRLIYTGQRKRLRIENVDGHCFVKHIDQIEDLNAWKDLDDTFWVADRVRSSRRDQPSYRVNDLEPMPARKLLHPETTRDALDVLKARLKDLETNGEKLCTLDMFSGAGGLSRGFHESGIIGDSYAIEIDTPACETLKKNSPDTRVYNQDAGVLLRWAAENELKVDPEVLIDMAGHRIPRMPARGKVDLIIGGPPCQGWSGLNRHKRHDCEKNSLLATYLSYVEYYHPKYFLLENVQGLLYGPLEEGNLEKGAVKFIFRVLTGLGYQCQLALLQAGEYGCPQSRRRVIFWASLPGYKLPSYPQPSHIFADSRLPLAHRRETKAPRHNQIVLGACMSDLPNFEWVNVHDVLPETIEQTAERARRAHDVLQCSTITRSPYIGENKQAYLSAPLSEYQRWLRKDVKHGDLHNHITASPSKSKCERVCNVPLRPQANHQSIPFRLLAHKHDRKEGLYGRLGIDQSLKVATTKIDPASQQWTLHPYAHRTYSVREYARAQGFPDNYIWDVQRIKVADIYKQIGNAVPVPFARALAKELVKVVMEKWEAERDVLSDSESQTLADIEEQIDIGDPMVGIESNFSDDGSEQEVPRSGTSYQDAILIDDSD